MPCKEQGWQRNHAGLKPDSHPAVPGTGTSPAVGSPGQVRAAPHLHSEGLDVVGAVGAAREVGQVELDLVPAVVQPHGHGADEGLHPSRALVVAGPETPADVLIIQHLGKEGSCSPSARPPAPQDRATRLQEGSLLPPLHSTAEVILTQETEPFSGTATMCL